MILTHHYIQFALPATVVLAEPAVLVALGVGLAVFLPEQEQGDTLVFELLVDLMPVGDAAGLGGQVWWWREQQPFQSGLIKIGR